MADERAAELIVRFLDAGAEPLTDAERVELNGLLRGDASARDLLADLSYQGRALRESMKAQQGKSPELGARNSERSAPSTVPVPSSAFRVPRFMLPLAAALLIVGAAVGVYLLSARPEASHPIPPAMRPIAAVLDAESGTLVVGERLMYSGDEFPTGDVSLDGGSAEFRLVNGVTVGLRGPTRMTVHDPLAATLRSGTASFDCPPDAKGYTVHLPGGTRVVDLGTRFSIWVNADGRHVLRTLEGAVEAIAADGETRTIRAGQAARIVGGKVVALSDDPVTSPLAAVAAARIEDRDNDGRGDAAVNTLLDAAYFAGPHQINAQPVFVFRMTGVVPSGLIESADFRVTRAGRIGRVDFAADAVVARTSRSPEVRPDDYESAAVTLMRGYDDGAGSASRGLDDAGRSRLAEFLEANWSDGDYLFIGLRTDPLTLQRHADTRVLRYGAHDASDARLVLNVLVPLRFDGSANPVPIPDGATAPGERPEPSVKQE